jgi:hypothetical protein
MAEQLSSIYVCKSKTWLPDHVFIHVLYQLGEQPDAVLERRRCEGNMSACSELVRKQDCILVPPSAAGTGKAAIIFRVN